MNGLCALILSLNLQQPALPAQPPQQKTVHKVEEYMPALAKPENPDFKYLIYRETERERKEKRMRTYSV